MTKDNSLELVKIIIDALEDKKAIDIRILDISNISVIADYFVIAGGNNKNQIQTLSDNVQEKLYKNGCNIKQIEGYDSANWVLLDCGDVIVHIFDNENRSFYDLERIWRDAEEVTGLTRQQIK